ncbi:MAG: DUF4399 domain-containing protein [Aquabacterium sp.]
MQSFITQRGLMRSALLVVGALLLTPLPSQAADEPLHPWITRPPKSPEPANYITNLRDGDRIETPYLLKFGLSQYGLAGISDEVPRTGHHHLLVNQDLPLDFSKPLPFTENYVHFGKGQMETVLTLKPGTYTLRMLLANHKHIPLFIYSPKITVTVTAFHPEIKPASLITPGVTILSPREGETVSTPMLMRLHGSGLNIGHEKIKANDAGHFRLLFRNDRGGTETVDLKRGQTEVWLRPPAGGYKVEAVFVQNASGKVTQHTAEQELTVR